VISLTVFFPVDKGNYANHEYSTRILAQVQQAGMDSYAVIGHSQGGMVGTHIHNYFWSGMEKVSTANGAKLIQSVGTPYKGSTAAGSTADLGNVFGIGCGSNSDLSLDGAANWLTGISQAARTSVSFYTTTYELGSFFGDWCSLPMNLVLQWPNDGVTELTYGNLPGAVNMGNKEKWCHSVDMGYAPQFTDVSRNAAMNQAAAR